MSKEGESFRSTLWKRLQELRSNYKDLEKIESLIEKWEKDYGPEHQVTVDEMIGSACKSYWSEISAREGTSIDDLIRTQWMPWTEGEFTVEKIPNGIQIYCTKCPMADAFWAIERVDLGVQFFCNEDAFIVEGYNPDIKFHRTKTLMEGDDCCDHRYTMK